MKTLTLLFVGLMQLLCLSNQAEAQFDSCIRFSRFIPGIEPEVYLSSSDSFSSYCHCFAYSQADGVYESLDDSNIILTRIIPLDPPINSIMTRGLGDGFIEEDKYQLRNGEFFPISNHPLRITWGFNKDTTVTTDSKGFLNFPLHKARKVGIVDSLGRIEAYMDIRDLKGKKNGLLQIGELKHEWVYKYYRIKTGIGTYQLKDFFSGEIVASGIACVDIYDQKYNKESDK